jgi:ABC-type multidrug transport system fused ATPase/permease subunit
MARKWVAKDTLFRGACGSIMRGLGGVAVNRRERTGFVERVADEFRNRDNFHLIIATEGTRSLQPGWKSGFYRIALAAGVPVIMAVVDYGKREVGLLATIMLSPATKPPTWRRSPPVTKAAGAIATSRPHRSTPMILLRDLGFSRNGDPLVTGATLQLHPGWKVGLTGANGCGKSSFLACCAASCTPTAATSSARPAG